MKKPYKISLANIPTPVQEIEFDGRKFLIKREEPTGVELSGNKVRKLEYLLDRPGRKKPNIFLRAAEISPTMSMQQQSLR